MKFTFILCLPLLAAACNQQAETPPTMVKMEGPEPAPHIDIQPAPSGDDVTVANNQMKPDPTTLPGDVGLVWIMTADKLLGTWTQCVTPEKPDDNYQSGRRTLTLSHWTMTVSVRYFTDAACAVPFTAASEDEAIKKYKQGIAGSDDISKVSDDVVKDYKAQLDNLVKGRDYQEDVRATGVNDGTFDPVSTKGGIDYLSFKIDSDGRMFLTSSCLDDDLGKIDYSKFPMPAPNPGTESDDSLYPKGCGNSQSNRATDFSKSQPYTKS